MIQSPKHGLAAESAVGQKSHSLRLISVSAEPTGFLLYRHLLKVPDTCLNSLLTAELEAARRLWLRG